MQKSLFKDAFEILQIDTGEIGKSRLRRFLLWLDKTGRKWSEPDLEEYKDYLQNIRDLHDSTIYQNVQALRAHYTTILANTDNYDHIPEEERADFVNGILKRLEFNEVAVNFSALVRNEEEATENMQVLFPRETVKFRNSQVIAFVNWLDETGRHWTQPDILDYKEWLMDETDLKMSAIGNAINAVRRRYHEVVDEGTPIEELSEEVRKPFLENYRKLLGYFDQFPSRLNPSREMLEDDPHRQSHLTPNQIRQLLEKPDTDTFTGVRDRALLALAIATGIQQFEICGVTVETLRQEYDGQLALFVPESKQREARYIPYEDHEWVLDWVDEWLELSEITDSFVFRGTYGNRDVLRPHGIAPETASDILTRYPITMYNSEIPLLFSDLRATCGRRWYDAELHLDEIERRLGTGYRRATLRLLGLRVRKVFTR